MQSDAASVPKGAKCSEDPSLLDLKLSNKLAAVDGVATIVPLVIGFPTGASTAAK